MFMKLYLLDYFEKNNKLPEIDKIFVSRKTSKSKSKKSRSKESQ